MTSKSPVAPPASPSSNKLPPVVVNADEEYNTGSSEDEQNVPDEDIPLEEHINSSEDEQNITDKSIPLEEHTGSSEDEQSATDDSIPPQEESAELPEEEKIKAMRLNVKTVSPYEDDSEIKQAIMTENSQQLDYLMELGEFDVDRSSRMAQLLLRGGQSGLTFLANLCVDLSAPKCLMALVRWSKDPDHIYWINEKVVFEYAKHAALKGNMICCIELMEKKFYGTGDYNAMIDLANSLYPHVRSLELGARLAKFMYGPRKCIFFYPHLVYHCSILGIHPSVVALSAQLIIEAGDSFDIPGYYIGSVGRTEVPIPNDGKRRAPLSEAARVLNRDIVRLLTHNSLIVKNFQHTIKNWEQTAEFNPLFTLLKQEFPFLAPAANSTSEKAEGQEGEEEEEEDKLITHPDDKNFYFQLHRAGHAMLDCLKLLKKRIQEMEGYNSADYTDMYQVACDIYTATVRELIIHQMRRHLPRKAQARLIELKKTEEEAQPGDNRKTPTQATIHVANKVSTNPNIENNEHDGTKKYKFLDTINGTFLRKTLENYDMELHPIFTTEVWDHLTEYENYKIIEAKVKAKVEYPKTTPLSALLYEYILDPDSRTVMIEPGTRDRMSSASELSEAGISDPDEDDEPLRGSWSGVVGFGDGGSTRE